MKAPQSTNPRNQLAKLTIYSGISALLFLAQPSMAASFKYVVKSGETLSELSQRFGVSQTQIIDANGPDASHLIAGEVIDIPDANEPYTYKVKNGDSLYSVAKTYGVTTSALAKINNIPINARLDIADTLILPKNAKLQTQSQTQSQTQAQTPAATIQPASFTRKSSADAVGKHRVMRGETLIEIANMYGVSVSALARENNISTNTLIRFGDLLTIPADNAVATPKTPAASAPAQSAPTTYKVKEGEGLIVIAKKFQIDFMDLARANDLEGYEQLIIGQTLKLPPNAKPISE